MTTTASVEHCRSCGMAIVWGITASGTAIPLDATDTGELVEVDDSPLAVVPILFRDGPVVRHIRNRTRGPRSHFATCPDAKSWRKSRSPQ